MKPLLKILTNPFLIAFLLSLALAVMFPVKQVKYKLERNVITVSANNKVFFRDVNHDGTFEKVILHYSDIMPRIGISTIDDKVYGETSTQGLLKPENEVAFYDINNDSTDEAFTIIRRNDSLFLAIAELHLNSNIKVRSKFLFTIGEVNGQPDWTVVDEYLFKDINNDGNTDVVFAYNALYSRQPRRIVVFDPKKDSIILSPVSGVKSSIFEITDINKDSYPEILLLTSSSENFKDTLSIPFHDHTPWMMALDHNLQFVNKPEPFYLKPAYFSLFTLQHQDSFFIAGFLNSIGVNNSSSAFVLINADLQIIKKVDIASNPGLYLRGLIHQSGNIDLVCLIDSKTGTMFLYDHKFKLKEKINLEPYSNPLIENRYVRQVTINERSFFVFQNDVVDPGFKLLDNAFDVVMQIDYPESWKSDQFAHYQIFNNADAGLKFYIQTGRQILEYDITFNKRWYFELWRYPAYYALLLGLVLLLQYLLKFRMEQKRKIENEILGLQLKSTLNQLDPHFTFNTLNMISGLIATDRREEANNYLIQFSRLMRATVIEGEKTMIPLEDELSFVNVYLAMQKIRLEIDFEYSFSIPEQIDRSILIPKRIIHTHVENAVKHGLMHKKGSKYLLIEARQFEKELSIVITDNGIGRERAKEINKFKSTGQGLRITRQILELTGNLANRKFNQEIIDIKDADGIAAGTKIILKMEI